MHTIYSFASFMHILVGVGKKKSKLEEEELLCTGTQEIATLKSVQKSPASFRFGQLEIFLSNENVVHGLITGNIRTKRLLDIQLSHVMYGT